MRPPRLCLPQCPRPDACRAGDRLRARAERLRGEEPRGRGTSHKEARARGLAKPRPATGHAPKLEEKPRQALAARPHTWPRRDR